MPFTFATETDNYWFLISHEINQTTTKKSPEGTVQCYTVTDAVSLRMSFIKNKKQNYGKPDRHETVAPLVSQTKENPNIITCSA